jgi:hypothetical protein
MATPDSASRTIVVVCPRDLETYTLARLLRTTPAKVAIVADQNGGGIEYAKNQLTDAKRDHLVLVRIAAKQFPEGFSENKTVKSFGHPPGSAALRAEAKVRPHDLTVLEEVLSLIAPERLHDVEVRRAAALARGLLPGLMATLVAEGSTAEGAMRAARDLLIRDQAIRAKAARATQPELQSIVDNGNVDEVVAEPLFDDAIALFRTLAQQHRLRLFTTGRAASARTRGEAVVLAAVPERFKYCAADAVLMKAMKPRKVQKGDHLELVRLPAHPGEQIEQPTTLLLFHEGAAAAPIADANITGLELRGDGGLWPIVEHWLAEMAGEGKSGARLSVDVMHSADACRLSIAAIHASDRAQIGKTADWLLDNLLMGSRPVGRWRTSFFQLLTDDGRETLRDQMENLAAAGDAARVTRLNPWPLERGYFLPHLRSRLTPEPQERGGKDLAPLDSYEIDLAQISEKPLAIEVRHFNHDTSPCARVASLRVHFFWEHTFLVEWTVAGAADAEIWLEEPALHAEQDEQCWIAQRNSLARKLLGDAKERRLWRRYLAASPAKAEGLAEVIDFIAEARFTFFAYDRKHTDRKGGEKRSGIVLRDGERELAVTKYQPAEIGCDYPITGVLAFFLGHICRLAGRAAEATALLDRARSPRSAIGPAVRLVPLADDRARVMTSLLLEGGAPRCASVRTGAFGPLLARLNMVDPYGIEHPYGPAFSARELKESTYGRYAEWGSHFLATDHSFAFLGFRGLPGEDNGGFGYSELYIHGRDMRSLYRRLFVLVLLQQAGLLTILTRVDDAVGHPEYNRRRLIDLRGAFLRFVMSYWFTRVSNQLQGVELFEHLHRRLKLESEREGLARRLQEFEEFEQNKAAEAANRRQHWLYLLGIPFAAMLFVVQIGEPYVRHLMAGLLSVFNTRGEAVWDTILEYGPLLGIGLISFLAVGGVIYRGSIWRTLIAVISWIAAAAAMTVARARGAVVAGLGMIVGGAVRSARFAGARVRQLSAWIVAVPGRVGRALRLRRGGV